MMFLDYLLTSVALGMTFLLGCTGEILTEKAGHLNLGIPGIMCIGGAFGCFALKICNGMPGALVVPVAILASLIGGLLMGALYCFLTVTLKANQNVTGLTMTIFGVGLMRYIMSELSTKNHAYLKALPSFRYPFSVRLPGTSWQ